MTPPTNPAPETVGGYPVHPVASMFPLLAGTSYEELKKSIEQHGQQEPIVLRNRVLIDGRSRLKVLLDLARQPVFREYDSPLAAEEFILIQNLYRRHLTDDQRIMIAAQAMYWRENQAALARQQSEGGKKHGRGRPKLTAISPQANRQPTVTEMIAATAQGTDYQARQAVAAIKYAPELVEKVKRGQIKLREVARLVEHRHTPTSAARPEWDFSLACEHLRKAVNKELALAGEKELTRIVYALRQIIIQIGGREILTRMQLENEKHMELENEKRIERPLDQHLEQ
jgi:hypothetical protein